jgi:hypothetical protein
MVRVISIPLGGFPNSDMNILSVLTTPSSSTVAFLYNHATVTILSAHPRNYIESEPASIKKRNMSDDNTPKAAGGKVQGWTEHEVVCMCDALAQL